MLLTCKFRSTRAYLTLQKKSCRRRPTRICHANCSAGQSAEPWARGQQPGRREATATRKGRRARRRNKHLVLSRRLKLRKITSPVRVHPPYPFSYGFTAREHGLKRHRRRWMRQLSSDCNNSTIGRSLGIIIYKTSTHSRSVYV